LSTEMEVSLKERAPVKETEQGVGAGGARVGVGVGVQPCTDQQGWPEVDEGGGAGLTRGWGEGRGSPSTRLAGLTSG